MLAMPGSSGMLNRRARKTPEWSNSSASRRSTQHLLGHKSQVRQGLYMPLANHESTSDFLPTVLRTLQARQILGMIRHSVGTLLEGEKNGPGLRHNAMERGLVVDCKRE